jgi:hypothetical protein
LRCARKALSLRERVWVRDGLAMEKASLTGFPKFASLIKGIRLSRRERKEAWHIEVSGPEIRVFRVYFNIQIVQP